MTVNDAHEPSPLSSTPSVPPTCPTNTTYAGGSVSLSPGLQVTGIQELVGSFPELDHLMDVSAAEADGEVEPSQVGGSRLSRRAVVSRKTQKPSRVRSRISRIMENVYSENNPEGLINLGVAENSLMAEDLATFYRSAFPRWFRKEDMTYGDHLWASKRLTAALAAFYNVYWRPSQRIEEHHLIIGNGIYSVLNQLYHTLLDPSEVVLISSPYYSGFDTMINKWVQGLVVGVPMNESPDGILEEGNVEARFGQALGKCRESGLHVRAIMLCNPHNPTGRTHSRETLRSYCLFAERYDLHLVVDEVYGMSVFSTDDSRSAPEFTSVFSLDYASELERPFDRSRVNVLHGLSKDFCSSGFRLGVLITQDNPMLVKAMASLSLFIKISAPADCLFCALLEESSLDGTERYRDWFIRENKRRLVSNYHLARDWLEARGFNVVPSNAGHFMWVDLGSKLGWKTVEDEEEGFCRIFDAGLYIVPGLVSHSNAKPGHFRITFSVDPKVLLLGLGRLSEIMDDVVPVGHSQRSPPRRVFTHER